MARRLSVRVSVPLSVAAICENCERPAVHVYGVPVDLGGLPYVAKLYFCAEHCP